MNTYQYCLIDLSLLLTRNVYACSRGKNVGEYTSGDVIKMTIQTINKIARDYGITADKVILLADMWDQNLGGYYRTWLLGGNYKDSRTWMTPEKLEEIKKSPDSTPEIIEKAEKELYTNQVKQESKEILKGDISRIGLPCFGVPGLEYDDLCYIISSILYSSGSTKKSIIVTKDSDCMYCTSPVVDYFRLPVGGSKPEILDYTQIYRSMVPDKLQEKGISLWEYKSIWDSLDGGHNDLRKTRKPKTDLVDVILGVLSGDYKGVSDVDLFLKQYETFKLTDFPMITDTVKEISTKLPIIGHLGDLTEFHRFCNDHGISGISDNYYNTFIGRFETKYFTE